MSHAVSAHEVHQLVLDALTRNAWRLCDRAVDSRNADSVVAYVERGPGGAYEVAWLSAGFGVEKFTSLEHVLRAAFERFERDAKGERIPAAPSPLIRARRRAHS